MLTMSREQHLNPDHTTAPKAAAERSWAAMSVRYAQSAHTSIGSDRVAYQPVFDHSGILLGTITRLRIDRSSGYVDEVVVLTHGHFGFGRREIELPWAALKYDITLPGYRLALGVTGSVADARPSTLGR
jgi:hypothetical protein